MIKFFTFVWELITGIVEIMSKLVEGIGVMSNVMLAFGAFGGFVIVLLTIRVVKWVANR